MARLLITNDDGIYAPGLLMLKQALARVGDVTVIAPDHNWSIAGHTKTMHKPMRVDPVKLADGSPAWVCTGTPSDCVALALLGLLPSRPDLVVSGINDGPNLGHDITYSGTVAGAMEATIFNVPAIAISCDFPGAAVRDEGKSREGFEAAAEFAVHLAQEVLAKGLPRNVFLNVNVPALPIHAIKGVQITRLGQRDYRDVLIERKDPRGRPYYWIGGEPPAGEPEEGTDVGALFHGYISVTPLNMDMTDHAFLAELRRWSIATVATGP